jgi:hypothetical protein
MLINRESLPRNRSWIAVFLLGTVAAVAAYGIASIGKPRWPGGSSPAGFVFGILAGAIMAFEVLLWPRKKLRTWRIGTASAWMRAHIWLGLLTVPLIVLHSGFVLGGQLSAVLTVLFGIVIISGLFGLLLQQFLPRMMLEGVPAETIVSQIDYLAEQSYWNAEDLVEAAGVEPIGMEQSLRPRERKTEAAKAFVTVGAVRNVGSVRGKVLETQVPAAVRQAFQPDIAGRSQAGKPDVLSILREGLLKTIGPFLLDGRKSSSPLRSQSASAAYFRGLRGDLGAEAAGIVDALEGLCEQRRQHDLQIRMHGWLHGWLCVHVPLSVALIGLMFVHIVVALKYW